MKLIRMEDDKPAKSLPWEPLSGEFFTLHEIEQLEAGELVTVAEVKYLLDFIEVQ